MVGYVLTVYVTDINPADDVLATAEVTFEIRVEPT